ncbi:MAG: iron ABC transporter permease [Verrucomicrobiota bacterium]
MTKTAETKYFKHVRHRFLLLLIFALVTMLISLQAIMIGPASIPLDEMFGIIKQSILKFIGLEQASEGIIDPVSIAVVESIRLPRILAAVLVGASLAVSGACMQSMLRNPLADPGLLGISSGAMFGACFYITLAGALTEWMPKLFNTIGTLGLPVFAITGALGTTLIVFILSQHRGNTVMAVLLLAGIAINACIGSATGYLIFLADDNELRSITFWTLGSLGYATWKELSFAIPLILLPVIVLLFTAKDLNGMLLGEKEAKCLGIHVQWVKNLCIILIAISVGTSVSICGMIGFVGLVVPHLVRICVGADNRFVLLGSVIMGPFLLVASDTVARTVVSPAEMPIGIITSLIGAPFFLFLLIKSKRQIVF